MSHRLRVFHCPIEIAGQMGTLVKGLNRFGHTAVGYNTFHTYLNYSSDIVNTDLPTVQQAYERDKNNFDIFHYHFGRTVYEDYHDLPELKSIGKKLVMHHWGNDVRTRATAQVLSPYLTDPCNPLSDDLMTEQLKRASTWVQTVVIQDFELLDYVKNYYLNIYVLPLAFNVASVKPHYPNLTNKVPLVVHAPTLPAFKGTVFVEAALDSLKKEGINFEYKRIEHMSHREAMSYYKKADIVVDQLLVGTYGTLSVEAMALGKPVVAYISQNLIKTFPESLPIINADPSTLAKVLMPYLADATLRHRVGVRSRRYAKAYHDIPQVIPKLIDIYKTVLKYT